MTRSDTEFPRDEIEAAFKNYFLTGPVMEDWIAWSQLFTDDAVYFDHFYGRFRGRLEGPEHRRPPRRVAAAIRLPVAADHHLRR